MIGLRDGIHIETHSGCRVVADARRSRGDLNVISHAHTDHLLANADAPVYCTDLTAALAGHRTGTTVTPELDPAVDIRLYPAGHILGSSAALITDEKRILYTGDVCTRDRAFIDGFSPVPADILIIEATYGRPVYQFPDHEEIETAIHDWIADANGSPLFLYGYPLGRAQKLHHIAHHAPGTHRLFVHETIDEINTVIERHTDLKFPGDRFIPHGDYGAGDVIIVPSSRTNAQAIQSTVDRVGGRTAGFSGWVVNDRFRHSQRYDAAFPLSDHCDFTELVSLVTAVDPETVYTHHGFAEAFATYLRTELDYDARPLIRNQTSLADY